MADRVVSAASLSFKAKVSGPVPQNTGLSAIDHEADRVIGLDAADKWSAIENRVAHKREILRDSPGAVGEDLSRTPDGSYRVMKPQERKASEAGRSLHQQALKKIPRQVLIKDL